MWSYTKDVISFVFQPSKTTRRLLDSENRARNTETTLVAVVGLQMLSIVMSHYFATSRSLKVAIGLLITSTFLAPLVVWLASRVIVAVMKTLQVKIGPTTHDDAHMILSYNLLFYVLTDVIIGVVGQVEPALAGALTLVFLWWGFGIGFGSLEEVFRTKDARILISFSNAYLVMTLTKGGILAGVILALT